MYGVAFPAPTFLIIVRLRSGSSISFDCLAGTVEMVALAGGAFVRRLSSCLQ